MGIGGAELARHDPRLASQVASPGAQVIIGFIAALLRAAEEKAAKIGTWSLLK